MPAGRFVVLDMPLAPQSELDLPAEVAHQVRDVLRLGVGATVQLLDGRGGEYAATVVASDRKRVLARVGVRTEGAAEPAIRVVLYQGMLKAAKFELVLQKGTELGVAAFMPLLTERAIATSEASGDARRLRWRRILAEAIEQCGGTRLPELAQPCGLATALVDRPADCINLFPWEEEREQALRPALLEAVASRGGLAHVREVRIFIGPEGGFSTVEAALARRHGALIVTLGPRILRAETAAIVAAALVLDAIAAKPAGTAGGSR